MSRRNARYSLEFLQQMIELVRAGRTPEGLSREFEPSAQAIRKRVVRGDRDEGRRGDGLTSTEGEEPRRLKRDNRRRRQEREIPALGETGRETIRGIVSPSNAWVARGSGPVPSGSSSSSK